jgi:hypothetical protein
VGIDDIPIHTPSVHSVSESAVLFQGKSKWALQHLLAESHALNTDDKGGVFLPACISFLSTPVSSIHTSDVPTVNSSTHDLRTEAVSPDTTSGLRLSAQLSAQTSLPPLFTNSAPPISISIAEELEPVTTSTYVTLRVLHPLHAFLNALSLFLQKPDRTYSICQCSCFIADQRTKFTITHKGTYVHKHMSDYVYFIPVCRAGRSTQRAGRRRRTGPVLKN